MKKPVYLPFADGKWRMAMGLNPLQLPDWIEIDDDFAKELQLKNKLLQAQYAEVFGSLPGSEAAQQEVLELLLEHLSQYFPEYYHQQGDRLINQITGQIWTLADFTTNPLDLAGRLVQEDLCLMLPFDTEYILAAGSVCFPSRWRLSEKLGRPLVEIHAPVPGYPDKLEQPVNKFFQRLKPEYPGYRLNWSIADSPELFLTPQTTAAISTDITSANAGDKLWVRIERQTLRRLARSHGILFTIRTYVHPLQTVVETPAMARNLAAIIQQIPPEMQAYKNIFPLRAVLLEYLEARYKDA